jgi:hypothetical protein
MGLPHMPENLKRINPVAIASVYNLILLFRLTFQGKLLSDLPIYQMGKGNTVLELEVHFTVRSDSNSQMKKIETNLEKYMSCCR